MKPKQPDNQLTLLLKEPEVAALFGVTTKTIHNLRNAGKIEFLKLGGGAIRFEPAAIERFKASSTIKPRTL